MATRALSKAGSSSVNMPRGWKHGVGPTGGAGSAISLGSKCNGRRGRSGREVREGFPKDMMVEIRPLGKGGSLGEPNVHRVAPAELGETLSTVIIKGPKHCSAVLATGGSLIQSLVSCSLAGTKRQHAFRCGGPRCPGDRLSPIRERLDNREIVTHPQGAQCIPHRGGPGVETEVSR